MTTIEPENTQHEVIDLFQDFNRWTKIHYYAFKLRKDYPNLFFHYFSPSGKVEEAFSKPDVKELLTTIRQFGKNMNGMWGFLSLALPNKNGIAVYKMISGSEFFNHSFSVACTQNGDPSFSNEINVSIFLNFFGGKFILI
jgi:hypothetical protein